MRCATITSSKASPSVRSAKATIAAATAGFPSCAAACRDGGSRLCLPDRREMRWGHAADTHSAPARRPCDDIVAIAQVREQLFEQIRMASLFPKVMMGIDDRQSGIDDASTLRASQAGLGGGYR
jgi:hypothetical protein